MRFPLTGFADEIGPDFEQQLETLQELGIGGLDLRNALGKNVVDLEPDQLAEIKATCMKFGIKVACIGSPVNKVDFTPENRKKENEKLAKCIKAAKAVGADRIRFFTPETAPDRHDADADGVLDWVAEQVDMAKDANLLLLHENDAKFWGAYPANSKLLFERFPNTNIKSAFDFANTVLLGFRAQPDWFPWLLPHLHTLHIKDAIQSAGKVVPAGDGEGQIEDTLRWLIAMGWHGPLTMEPHLQAAGAFGGFSGPQLFEVATNKLKDCLMRAGGEA